MGSISRRAPLLERHTLGHHHDIHKKIHLLQSLRKIAILKEQWLGISKRFKLSFYSSSERVYMLLSDSFLANKNTGDFIAVDHGKLISSASCSAFSPCYGLRLYIILIFSHSWTIPITLQYKRPFLGFFPNILICVSLTALF